VNAERDFVPESALDGFAARPQPTRSPRSVPPRSRAAGDPAATTVPATQPGRSGPPPFGTRRGRRIAYTVNLPCDLAAILDVAVVDDVGRVRTFGQVVVEAMRVTAPSLQRRASERSRLAPAFPRQVELTETIAPGQDVERRVFYVSEGEARAIDELRHQLGAIPLGQLHRIVLRQYFAHTGVVAAPSCVHA